jgi:hypothetical protein
MTSGDADTKARLEASGVATGKLSDALAYNLPAAGGLNARWSRDFTNANYLSPSAQEIRFVGHPAHLAEMKRLYDAKDYATLAQLKESEQNANVLRLLLADVPDIQSTLQGRLPVDKIDLICDVRRAYLVRLLHVLFPSSKPEHVPPRVKTAVHNLMIGRLGRTKLLELIDHGHDPHKIEDPLAGFAALSEPRAVFNQAIMLAQRIICYASPGQTCEAIGFFGLLVTTVDEVVRKIEKAGRT